jgi:hypothetical protein
MTRSLAWLYALLTAVVGLELALDHGNVWDVLKITIIGILAMQISYFVTCFVMYR